MKKNLEFKILNFNAIQEPPVNTLDKANGFVKWGKQNEYSQYLMNMYNHKGSGVHKAIINRKIKMIAGQGFVDLDRSIDTLNITELAKRLALDYEIYNAYAFEVIYAKDRTILELNHVPFGKLRKGIDSDEVQDYWWYSTDWSKFKQDVNKPQFISEWSPENREGRQLYVYMDYNPDADIYPVPGYSAELNWIELDYEISKFHLNQAKNGYAPQFILNFGTGIPSDEEMDEVVRGFKREYKGSTGETIMITFSEGSDQKPELIPIALNDSDERFVTLSKEVKENIFIGHEVTNPQLFGVRVPGELGGKQELVDSLDIFQAVYVNQRQSDIENGINHVLGTSYKLAKFEI